MQKSLSAQIRKIIKKCGMSRYRICKMIGIQQAVMSRFMNDNGGLSMEMLDKLAALLKLEVVSRKEPHE
jgi:transcriptional regulator with XRE-family HTH domain